MDRHAWNHCLSGLPPIQSRIDTGGESLAVSLAPFPTDKV